VKPAWNVIDYEAGKIRVCERKCSTCVFRAGDKMFLGPGRLKEVVDGNLEAGTLLTCHKTLPYSIEKNDPAVCRGFWDSYGLMTAAGRVAQFVIGIIFVTIKEDVDEQHQEGPGGRHRDQPEEDEGSEPPGQ
jgi:hypothetical protein